MQSIYFQIIQVLKFNWQLDKLYKKIHQIKKYLNSNIIAKYVSIKSLLLHHDVTTQLGYRSQQTQLNRK